MGARRASGSPPSSSCPSSRLPACPARCAPPSCGSTRSCSPTMPRPSWTRPRRSGMRLIAHRPDKRNEDEYDKKEQQARDDHSLDKGEPVLFLEVLQGDASDFTEDLQVRGAQVGRHRVLRCTSPADPQRHRRPAPAPARPHRPHSRCLLRLDGGQPRDLRAQVPGPGRGRHRPRHPRGAEARGQEPAGAARASTWDKGPRSRAAARTGSAVGRRRRWAARTRAGARPRCRRCCWEAGSWDGSRR